LLKYKIRLKGDKGHSISAAFSAVNCAAPPVGPDSSARWWALHPGLERLRLVTG